MSLVGAALLWAASSVPAVVPQPRGPSWPGQEGATQGTEAEEQALQEKITRYIDLARTGKVPVRPQAARRLVQLGPPAAARLLLECSRDEAGLVEFGPYLVEVLGAFENAQLRVLLWRSLGRASFPWRAPAARTLAGTAREEELEAFLELSYDRIAPVRQAAISALGRFDGDRERLRARLVQLAQDGDDRVRRDAAAQLDAWGEHGYLLWLVFELQRTDDYFGMPLGERARFEALRLLKERLGDDFGFRAEDSPHTEGNRAAFERLKAAAQERAGGGAVELPPIATPGRKTEGDVIGLELRSCRTGDLFLRWNAADVLYVGSGQPCALALEPGTVERLLELLRASTAKVGDERYWGDAGCDIEQLRLVRADGELDVFLVSKGQAPVPDLRPAGLDEAVRALVGTLPNSPEGTPAWDPRAVRLRERVREALLLLGGEYRGA